MINYFLSGSILPSKSSILMANKMIISDVSVLLVFEGYLLGKFLYVPVLSSKKDAAVANVSSIN